MLKLVKINNKPIKYRVWDNDVYLVKYRQEDIDDINNLKDVVLQGGCTGCTFRPNDQNCKASTKDKSIISCIFSMNFNDKESYIVYMRDELIWDYESQHNVQIISPKQPKTSPIEGKVEL